MKVPLLEYLDKLEATVKAAPQGDWSAPRGSWPSSRYGEVVSNEHPTTEGYGGKLIAESCDRLVAPHIVATQPKNVLALIAKLREAVLLVSELHRQMKVNQGGIGPGAGYDNTEREDYRRFVEDHIKRTCDFGEIEVPE